MGFSLTNHPFPGFSITEMCLGTRHTTLLPFPCPGRFAVQTHLFSWGQIKVKDLVQKARGLKKETERFHMVFSLIFLVELVTFGWFLCVCWEWSIAIYIYMLNLAVQGTTGVGYWTARFWIIARSWTLFNISICSRWWFQTFFIFAPTRGNDPIWEIFFK